MRIRKPIIWMSLLAGLVAAGIAAGAAAQEQVTPRKGIPAPGYPREPPVSVKAVIGQNLFFDKDLSNPRGQSCASCHDRSAGWADPAAARDPANSPTSEGTIRGRFGFRNAPTLAYVDHGPALFYDATCQCYVGGRYRDGHAATPEQQVKVPFLSRAEMNNPGIHNVVREVRRSEYAPLFELVYGRDVWNDEKRAFDGITESLVEFQTSADLNPFGSRYDRFLRGDPTALTPQELAGLALFEGKGTCSACHPSQQRLDGSLPLFTTFRYENLGVPRNPANPYYGMPHSINPDGAAFVDRGLGGVVGLDSEMGKFKIPSLRNVALTPPYMHNGLLTDLIDVVQFHNTRDIDPRWGPPEIAQNLSIGPVQVAPTPATEGGRRLPPGRPGPPVMGGHIGNLGLNAVEVDEIVAFLRTLTDV